MRKTAEEEAIELKSEERRALVLLGLTAILASALLAMLSAVWTNARKPEDFFYNFPLSSVPHLTTYLIPDLELFIGFWLGYAFFVFWYFCVDWFPGPKGKKFRETCHLLSRFFLAFYVIFFVWLIPVSYLILVVIPSSLNPIFISFAIALLVVLEFKLAASGQMSDLAKSFRWYLRRLYEVVELPKELLKELLKMLKTIRRKKREASKSA